LSDRFHKGTFLLRRHIERVFIVACDNGDDRPFGQWLALEDDLAVDDSSGGDPHMLILYPRPFLLGHWPPLVKDLDVESL
jgi:hypothetical protein